MNQRVFTKFGQGTVIALFDDGTYCVRLDSGGGVILMAHEVFTPILTVANIQQASYSMAC